MASTDLPKYDRITRWLHIGLAAGVVLELLLTAVMHVPPGPGLGVRDWHREAFEIHVKVGPTVAVICALQWLWVCLPFSRPGVAYLFPWIRHDRRAVLSQEFKGLLRLDLSSSAALSPLAGTVHGLGLCAVTGSVVGGLISYLAYYQGVPVPSHMLHWVSLEQIFMSWMVWAFVIAHVSMALWHLMKRDFSILRIFCIYS